MNSLKNYATASIVGFVMCALIVTWLTARGIDREAILVAEKDKAALKELSQSLKEKVVVLKSEKLVLHNKLNSIYIDLEKSKEERFVLEVKLNDSKFHTRMIDSTDQLVKRYFEVFPQFSGARDIGVVTIFDIEDEIEIDYFIQPAFFIETFILEHDALVVKEEQLEIYKADEIKYGKARELSTKIIMLEAKISVARGKAFNTCEAKYNRVNDNYVSLLKKPPIIEFKAPSLLTHSLAALAGFGTCVGIGMSF